MNILIRWILSVLQNEAMRMKAAKAARLLCISGIYFAMISCCIASQSKPMVFSPFGPKLCIMKCCLFNCKSFDFDDLQLTCNLYGEGQGHWTTSNEDCSETVKQCRGKWRKCRPFYMTMCGERSKCVSTSIKTINSPKSQKQNGHDTIILLSNPRSSETKAVLFSIKMEKTIQQLQTAEMVIGGVFDPTTKDLYLGTYSHLHLFRMTQDQKVFTLKDTFSRPNPSRAMAIADEQRLLFISNMEKIERIRLPVVTFSTGKRRLHQEVLLISVLTRTRMVLYVIRGIDDVIVYKDNYDLNQPEMLCVTYAGLVAIDVKGNLHYARCLSDQDLRANSCLKRWPFNRKFSRCYAVLPIATGLVYACEDTLNLTITNWEGKEIKSVKMDKGIVPVFYWTM